MTNRFLTLMLKEYVHVYVEDCNAGFPGTVDIGVLLISIVRCYFSVVLV